MFEQAIPPSDGDESDEEVYQYMLARNNVTEVQNATYHPPSSNADYSQLSIQISSSPGKFSLITKKIIFNSVGIYPL